jgi:thymidylate synthase
VNHEYGYILDIISQEGLTQSPRGAETKSIFGYHMVVTAQCLITWRKTQWKTALQELEWFMSGDEECPEGVLRDVWWHGQLDYCNNLVNGYSSQLRNHTCDPYGRAILGRFDQIAWLREELKSNPQSRRSVLSTWNPGEMAHITEANGNSMSPACCHLVYCQFQVRDGELHMNTVFRSSDAVLGLPHNIVQHRALQLYFAHHAGVPAACYYKAYLNDVHVYKEHSDFTNYVGLHRHEIVDCAATLKYTPTDIEFKAEDFTFEGEIDSPLYTTKLKRTL